jgi:hypothetical protein
MRPPNPFRYLTPVDCVAIVVALVVCVANMLR